MKEVNKTTVIYLNKRKFGVTVSLKVPLTLFIYLKIIYYVNCGGRIPLLGLSHISTCNWSIKITVNAKKKKKRKCVREFSKHQQLVYKSQLYLLYSVKILKSNMYEDSADQMYLNFVKFVTCSCSPLCVPAKSFPLMQYHRATGSIWVYQKWAGFVHQPT